VGVEAFSRSPSSSRSTFFDSLRLPQRPAEEHRHYHNTLLTQAEAPPSPMVRVGLALYGLISTAAFTWTVVNAFRQRSNFYAAAVYLSKSNACMMVRRLPLKPR
jgi:hypothetical protein